jgi:hypothetical protein
MEKFLETFKKDIQENWLSGFKEESKFEDSICLDDDLKDFHQVMGEIRSPDDFWHFYLDLKRNDNSIIPAKLTVFQRCKANQFFIEYLGDPVIHWFFIQAIDALEHSLYIPACSSILNGIEASLRVTIHQLEKSKGIDTLSQYQVLSNSLILKAADFGIPVESLKLPYEMEFEGNLNSKKPDRTDVEVVRIRNNICHGNIIEYIETIPDEEYAILTPECLRKLAYDLIEMSTKWTYSIGIFRIEKLLNGHVRNLIKRQQHKNFRS